MQLHFSWLILAVSALAFVDAYTERYRDLRILLKYEYRPKYWFSHLKYVNYFGYGTINDWDSLVIIYIDEEYREFLQKEMGSERADFNEIRYLLLREIKVGDTLSKSIRELGEHWKKMREGRVNDVFGEIGMDRTLVKYREIVVERLWKCVYAAIKPIRNVFRWAIGVSRNVGIIYEGAIYTILLNGNPYQVATLPTAYGKNYDPTAALNLAERIGFCIDKEWENLKGENFRLTGWSCSTDPNENWQPDIKFMEEKWYYPSSELYFN